MGDKGENEPEDEDEEDEDDDDDDEEEDGKDFEKDKFLQNTTIDHLNNIEMIVSGVTTTDYPSKESGKKKNKFKIYWSHYRK